MRIAMVSEHASPLAVVGGVDAGGQNVHVAALSQALAERGHQVVVYTRRDDPHLPRRVQLSPGVTVTHLSAGPPTPIPKDELLPFVPHLGRDLARCLAVDRPAVVHAHFWMSGLAAIAATADSEMPVVQTFHALGSVKRRWQGAADTSPPTRIRTERGLIADAARVIATCTDEVRELVAMGADRADIDVVPCGVNTDDFSPAGACAARSGRPRLLVLGRLVPRKGIDDAVRALATLPDAELLVAGGSEDVGADPEVGRLRQIAAELGVEDRLHLIGRVPRSDVAALIRSADLVLCLPWYEPFGIVPIEAMACGVPVVGSAVGGQLDTIPDGVTGRLVPPRRPDVVSRVVCELLRDPAQRARMGAAGVERAKRYRWSAVAAMTERSYMRTLMTTSAAQAGRAVG